MSTQSHDLAGWHARAKPYPDAYEPSRENLAFAVLHSLPAIPQGFSLALFRPDIAVDATGTVLILTPRDFAGLVGLADRTVDLPPTGSFRNAWRIDQPTTSQPIERLVVPGADGGLVETSVQGYEKGKTELQTPVGERTHLPPVLDELFALIQEAREGYESGKGDTEVINKVKALIKE